MSGHEFQRRAHDRILKVARTMADLAGSDRIEENHVLKPSLTAASTARGGNENAALADACAALKIGCDQPPKDFGGLFLGGSSLPWRGTVLVLSILPEAFFSLGGVFLAPGRP